MVKKLFNFEEMRQALHEILLRDPVSFLELGARIGVSEMTVRRFLLEDSRPKYITSYLISKYIKKHNKQEA